MINIQPYNVTMHYEQLVECLEKLQRAKSSYPPKDTTTNRQPSAADWLKNENAEAIRYVALLDNQVVGHIALTAPYDYLINFLTSNAFIQYEEECSSYLEIGTFFVSPSAHKHGIGGQLLSHAIMQTVKLGKIPALVVVESHDSHKAISLYEKHGMHNIGNFQGTHGKNLIFLHKCWLAHQ